MKRREFLRISAGLTGTTLACLLLPSTEVGAAEAVPGGAWSVAARLHLLPDGSALVRVEKSEMGQGVTTALPMLIAEELELPWNAVRIELAPADHAFRDARGNQSTGYSSSVSSSFIPLRTLGAAARQMLEAAAAMQWGLAPDRVGARSGRVIDLANPDRSLSYAELLDAARRIAPPASPRLKQPADYTLIGRPISRSDTPGKVDGSTRFGIDIAWPGLRIAMIERAPHPAAVLLGCDEAAALAVPGVERVLQLPRGIALVGRDTWSVRRGRAALAARWTALTDDSGDTPRHRARLDAALGQPGRLARDDGDIDLLRREPPGGSRWIERRYEAPFLAHAAMEPLAVTLSLEASRCEVWVGTQAPSRVQDRLAEACGLPASSVHVHSLPIGGAFGRRGEVDYVLEALEVVRAAGVPVKLVWSREDDFRHDFFRPASAHRLAACIGVDGQLLGLEHRMAAPSIARRRSPALLARGHDFLMTQGSSDHHYAIASSRVDYHEIDLGVPVGFWRSVGHSYNGWVIESFIDEIAAETRRDPLELRLHLLPHDARMQAVLRLAAARYGWEKALPRGVGRGIACLESYGTRVAQVVEVDTRGGSITVRRIVCAVDCGTVVNPNIVEQQVQGSIVFGLTAALQGRIEFVGGVASAGNFHQYPVARMGGVPPIEVHLVPSLEPPSGCGEPATPVIAPALCNAIRAATGLPRYSLPLLES